MYLEDKENEVVNNEIEIIEENEVDEYYNLNEELDEDNEYIDVKDFDKEKQKEIDLRVKIEEENFKKEIKQKEEENKIPFDEKVILDELNNINPFSISIEEVINNCNKVLENATNAVKNHKPIRKSDLNNFYNNFISNLKVMKFNNGGLEKFIIGAKLSFGRVIALNNLYDVNTLEAKRIKNFFENPVESVKNILGNKIQIDKNKYNQTMEYINDFHYFDNLSLNDISSKCGFYLADVDFANKIDHAENYDIDSEYNKNINIKENTKDNDLLLFAYLGKLREKYNSKNIFSRWFSKEGKEERQNINKIKEELLNRGYLKSDINSIKNYKNKFDLSFDVNKAIFNKNQKEFKEKVDFYKSMSLEKANKYSKKILPGENKITLNELKLSKEVLNDLLKIIDNEKNLKTVKKMNDGVQIIKEKMIKKGIIENNFYDLLSSKKEIEELYNSEEYIKKEVTNTKVLMNIDNSQVGHNPNEVNHNELNTKLETQPTYTNERTQ